MQKKCDRFIDVIKIALYTMVYQTLRQEFKLKQLS